MFPDARLPTEAQRKKLSELLCRAFLEIRYLGWNQRAEQVADLADALHNLPSGMWSEHFSISDQRGALEAYNRRWEGSGRELLKILDEASRLA